MTTALLVIDVQESFRNQPVWGQISDPQIARKIGSLVAAARSAGDRVIWVLHAEPGTGGPFDPATGFVRLMAGLEPADGEPVLTKTVHNAFTTTNLAEILTEEGITRLRVSGIRTEQCVETTARLASDLGYEVEFVRDATATHPLPLADGSSVLRADEVIERTTAALAGRFATIVTLAELGVQV
ncbi:MAG: cysteine hydrolase family protein [Gordonia sp. (in: high G+C Gram-positive bacteria)]